VQRVLPRQRLRLVDRAPRHVQQVLRGAHISLIEIRPVFTRPTDTEIFCSPGSACSCWTAPLGVYSRSCGATETWVTISRLEGEYFAQAWLRLVDCPPCGMYSRSCAEYRNAGEIRRYPARPCLARRLLRLQGCPASSTGRSRRYSKHECAGSLELFSVLFCFLFASGFNNFRAQPGLQLHLQRQLPIVLTDVLRLLIT